MKRLLYHCTANDHGEWLTIDRRTPQRSDSEPSTPRLCVCPSVAGCFAARLFSYQRPVFVYRTERPCRGIEPRDVWDACITRERWLIPPGRLQLITILDEQTVAQATAAIWMFHQYTRKKSNWNLRIAQLAVAAKVLRVEFPDTPQFERIAEKHLHTHDAEDWILSQIDAFLKNREIA